MVKETLIRLKGNISKVLSASFAFIMVCNGAAPPGLSPTLRICLICTLFLNLAKGGV